MWNKLYRIYLPLFCIIGIGYIGFYLKQSSAIFISDEYKLSSAQTDNSILKNKQNIFFNERRAFDPLTGSLAILGNNGPTKLEARASKIISIRKSLGRWYSPFFINSGLPENDIEKLSDLLTARRIIQDDMILNIKGKVIVVKALYPLARKDGSDMIVDSNISVENRSDWYVKIDNALSDINNQIRDLIGDDLYAYYSFYEESLELRNTVISHIQMALSNTNISQLSNNQIDKILLILASDNPHWPFSNSFINLDIEGVRNNISSIIDLEDQSNVILSTLTKEKKYWADIGIQITPLRK